MTRFWAGVSNGKHDGAIGEKCRSRPLHCFSIISSLNKPGLAASVVKCDPNSPHMLAFVSKVYRYCYIVPSFSSYPESYLEPATTADTRWLMWDTVGRRRVQANLHPWCVCSISTLAICVFTSFTTSRRKWCELRTSEVASKQPQELASNRWSFRLHLHESVIHINAFTRRPCRSPLSQDSSEQEQTPSPDDKKGQQGEQDPQKSPQHAEEESNVSNHSCGC